jgi:prepilin-type processing-associated H-X9-DG protein
MPCTIPGFGQGLGLWGYISAAPRSRHAGGVNTAYLDGHVDFLGDDVDPFAMANLVNIHDSETAAYVPSADDPQKN